MTGVFHLDNNRVLPQAPRVTKVEDKTSSHLSFQYLQKPSLQQPLRQNSTFMVTARKRPSREASNRRCLGEHRSEPVSIEYRFRQDLCHRNVHPLQGFGGEPVRGVISRRIRVRVPLPHVLCFFRGAVEAHEGRQIDEVVRVCLNAIDPSTSQDTVSRRSKLVL